MRFSKFLSVMIVISLFISLGCSSGGGDTTGPPPPTAPSKPTNVQVNPGQCGSGEITISWTASRGATGYHVYRDSTDANPITITATSWKDTGLTPGSSHTYQVDAFNDTGNSPKASVSATALGMCPPTVSLSANPTSIVAGTNTQVVITVTSTNADSCMVMPQGGVVGTSFSITPTQTSTYTVECSGPGGKNRASITITVTPAPPIPYIKVRVWAAAPGPQGTVLYGPVSGLSVTVKSGTWVSTTPMTVEGNMAWDSIPTPPSVQALMGSVDSIIVDATNPDQRVYIPSLRAVPHALTYSSNLSFILTPLSWTIQSGTYAGTVVPIQIGKALLPAGDGSCYWCIDGPLDSAYIWQNYPVPVFMTDTLPNGRGTPPIPHTAADSIELWRQLDSMEQRYGENLFQPVTWNNVGIHGIRVEFDYTLFYAGVGGSGGRNNYFYAGAIAFRSGVVGPNGTSGAFTYPGLIAHEFGHTLGMGHTCSWFTLMFTNCELLNPPVFNQNSPIVTPGDVAYFQVLRNVRTIQIAQGASFGLSESYEGERGVLGVVSTYLAPRLPSSASIRGPITKRNRDGIPLLAEPSWK